MGQMGYGSRALHALNSFYSGEYFNLDESNKPEASYPDVPNIDPVCDGLLWVHRGPDFMCARQSETLLTEKPTIRSPNVMPPLLQRLTERKPESLDYLGVSYGLTPQLLR